MLSYWPQRPSTKVVVVVTVRCRRWGCSWMDESWWAPSHCVLLSCSRPLLLQLLLLLLLLWSGVLAAEKQSVFVGVAAWLSDSDRLPEVACCFLLRSVLKERSNRKKRKKSSLVYTHTNKTTAFQDQWKLVFFPFGQMQFVVCVLKEQWVIKKRANTSEFCLLWMISLKCINYNFKN